MREPTVDTLTGADWDADWDQKILHRASLRKLLGQDGIWVTRDGRSLAVDEIPYQHLSNIQKFLENHAGALRDTMWIALFSNPPAGEMAADTVERGLVAEDELSPAEYMGQYPLYIKISELLGDRRFETQGEL